MRIEFGGIENRWNYKSKTFDLDVIFKELEVKELSLVTELIVKWRLGIDTKEMIAIDYCQRCVKSNKTKSTEYNPKVTWRKWFIFQCLLFQAVALKVKLTIVMCHLGMNILCVAILSKYWSLQIIFLLFIGPVIKITISPAGKR